MPPALKRLLRQPPGSWDRPELPEIGGPLEREGAVADAQARLASLLGVAGCWFGVNGATGLLQAALTALAGPGQAVLLPRNAHRSLIAGCVLGGIRPVFLPVPFLSDRGHPGAMSAQWLDSALMALPSIPESIVAAVLVSLDAEGGRLLDAVTVTSVWKGSSGSLLMGDDPPETPSPFGPLVLDWWEEIRSCRRVEAKDGLRRIDVMEGGFTLGDIGSV